MRIVLPLFAVMLASAAPAAQPAPALDRGPLLLLQDAPRGAPMFDRMPLEAIPNAPRTAPMLERVCRDRIQGVRDERGLPRLDHGTAPGDEALLIAAVDQRIDGCSVMVMRNNTSDIRPVPTEQGAPRVRRIPGQ